MGTEREVIRCPSCNLNQFMTASGLCRKPECGRPLKGYLMVLPIDNVPRITPGEIIHCPPRVEDPNFYRPEFLIITPKDIFKSNVRRYRHHSGLTIMNFPTELRRRCIEYAKDRKITLRDVVINSLKKFIDTE